MGTGKQISLEFLDHVDVLSHDKDGLKTLTNESKKIDSNYVKEVQLLELLLLQYIFLNNDGKISFSEKMALKKYYFKFRSMLDKDDVEFLNHNLKSNCMLANTKNYMNSNNINSVMVEFLIKGLFRKKIISKKYKGISDTLINELK